MSLDPRKTIFVGGVPRPLKAGTCLMFRLYLVLPYSVAGVFSGVGADNGPTVRRCLLRGHRYGSGAEVPEGRGTRILQQPAGLYGSHLGAFRSAESRRGRETSESYGDVIFESAKLPPDFS